jgi:ATP-dependent helicase/nuclease subunit B
MKRLIRKIKEGCSSSCLVLAPRRVSVNRIRKELVEKLGFIFDLKIMTVPEFVKSITAGNNLIYRQLPDEVAAELLGQLASQQTDGNIPFSSLLRRISGQKLALNTLQSLINADISPDDISSIDSANIKSIYTLYRDYSNFCKANNIGDRAFWLSQTISNLEDGAIELPNLTDVFIFDFNNITAPLARLLKVLEQEAELYFSLPYDPDRLDHFVSNSAAITKFQLDDGHWQLPIQPGSPLEGLQKHLFGSSTASYPAGENISFHNVPGRFDEVEAAAVKIRKLIIEKDVSPSRIALGTRNLGTYNQFIETVMQKLGIPFTYRRGTPLLQSPFVRLVMKLLECHNQKVGFQRLLAIVRSSFLQLEGNNPGWQKLIVNAGIFKEDLDKWPLLLEKRYLYCNNEKERANLEKTWNEYAGEQLVKALNFLTFKIIEISSAESPLAQLQSFCNSSHFLISEQPESETWEKHLFTFNKLLEKLINNNSIIRELGLKPMMPELDQLREELKQATIHEKQYLEESVSVVSTFDLGYLGVDHLFLVGMDEHTIPKTSYSSNILLSDNDLFDMKETGLNNIEEISSSHSRRIAEEQAFILAIGAAAKSVHLYHAAIAVDGRELAPSPYFAEVLRLAGNPEIISEPGGDSRHLLESVPEEASIQRQLIRHLYRTDIATDDSVSSFLAWKLGKDSKSKEFLDRINSLFSIEESRSEALFNRELLNKWTGKIDELETLKDRLKLSQRDWSATAIQTFASCPFDFFLRYVLFLEEMRLPGEEPDPMNLGSIYHRILERFVNNVKYPLDSAQSVWPAMKEAMAAEIPDFNQPAEELFPHTLLLLKKTSDIMERFINFELQHETGIPFKTEYEFDGDKCSVTLSDGSDFRLKGCFDRIDSLPEEQEKDYLIIDYKLGSGKSSSPTETTFSKGRNLQMPLYLMAASQILDVPVDKLQGLFIGLKRCENGQVNYPGKKSWRVPISPEDKSGKDEKCLKEILAEIIGEISRGEFPVSSRDGSKIRNMTNLVGRWLELPPEFADSGE